MKDSDKLKKLLYKEIINQPITCESDDKTTRDYVQNYLDKNKTNINLAIIECIEEQFVNGIELSQYKINSILKKYNTNK